MDCPLCDESFDDQAAFTGHLGAAHELYDEEGTSSEASLAAVHAPETESAPTKESELLVDDAPGPELIDGIPASRVYDPTADDAKYRPAVIVACVLLLIGAVTFATVFSGSDPESDEQADAVPTTVTSGGLAVSAVATEPPPTSIVVDPAATDTTLAAVAETTTTTARRTTPTTRRTTPTTTVTTTAPPPPAPPPPPPPAEPPPSPPTTVGFVAPSATSARIDECTRSGSEVTWHFSYVLSGGSGWSPGPSVTASGGRYHDHRTGRVQDGITITSVQVLDDAGAVHTVALQPALSSDRCR